MPVIWCRYESPQAQQTTQVGLVPLELPLQKGVLNYCIDRGTKSNHVLNFPSLDRRAELYDQLEAGQRRRAVRRRIRDLVHAICQCFVERAKPNALEVRWWTRPQLDGIAKNSGRSAEFRPTQDALPAILYTD